VVLTLVVLIVVTSVYYIASGVFDRSSRLYRVEHAPRDDRRRILTRQPGPEDGLS
jgi:hypothetical protein